MQLLSSDQLGRVRAERRELEVYVAKTIGRYLIERQRHHMRDLILAMIDRIVSLPLCEPTGERGRQMEEQLDLFLRGQTKFAMWAQCNAQPSLHALGRVGDVISNNSPVESYTWLCVCSDVIRLFGELAEQNWVLGTSDIHWHIMAGKNKLRPEPVYAKVPRDKQGKIDAKDEHGGRIEWDGFGHRDRTNRLAAEKRRMGAPFLDIPRQRVEWRGVETFSFGDESVIQTMDWAYGLQIEGGDVSGTTADSIAALRYAAGGEPNAVAQLIAIATMVPQGHHTIVECAWPLTRQGYMKYEIGFYGTLAPDQGCPGLRSTLEIFDNDARNKHMLVCRAMAKSDWQTWQQRADGSRIAPVKELALHFDKADELAVYRRLAGIRTAYAFCAGGNPTLDSVANFIQTYEKGFLGKQIVDRAFSKYHVAR